MDDDRDLRDLEVVDGCLAALRRADVAAASAYADRLVLLERLERHAACLSPEALEVRRREDRTDDPVSRLHAAAAEVASATHTGSTTAMAELRLACRMVRRFPEVVDRLRRTVQDGPAVTAAQVRVLHRATDDLDDERTRRVVDRVLARAAGDTTAGFAARVRRTVIAMAEETAVERRRRAVAARRVRIRPEDDGTATLVATGLPAALARAMDTTLTDLARRAVDPQDRRTVQQRRVDNLLGCVLGPGRVLREPEPWSLFGEPDDGTDPGDDPYVDPPVLDVPTATEADAERARAVLLQARDLLAGIGWDFPVPPRASVRLVHDLRGGGGDGPTDLDGHGPLDPEAVAAVLESQPAGRDRVVDLVDVPPADPGYRPSAATRRYVVARDRTCRWPGCTRRAEGCDLDHVTPYADGGPTHADNLVALCRHHHRLKHQTAWRARLRPDGVAVWTSPTRRVHLTYPGLDPP